MNWLVRFVLRVVVLAAIIYGVTKIYSGIQVDPNPDGPLGSAGTYLWIALLFALVNSILGPLVRLLSLPFIVLTLGLFLLIVNALMVGITAKLSDRLNVSGFVGAVVAGFLIAVFSWVAELLLPLKVRST
jgi:putative membrane protein